MCASRRHPVIDMVRIKRALSGSKSRLIGRTAGVMTAGECKIGIMRAASSNRLVALYRARAPSLTRPFSRPHKRALADHRGLVSAATRSRTDFIAVLEMFLPTRRPSRLS